MSIHPGRFDDRKIELLGISGSLRRASHNTAILRTLQHALPETVRMTLFPLNEIPLYNQELDGEHLPEPVRALKEAIAACDGVVIASPEYNYGPSGVLKNAIDWLSRMTPQPFAGKPIAIFGASGGVLGTARAQYQRRQIMVFLDGRVVNKPEVMIGGAANRFADGKLTDEATGKLLADLGAALVLAVRHARAAAQHVK